MTGFIQAMHDQIRIFTISTLVDTSRPVAFSSPTLSSVLIVTVINCHLDFNDDLDSVLECDVPLARVLSFFRYYSMSYMILLFLVGVSIILVFW